MFTRAFEVLLITAATVLMVGCASSPKPQFTNGNWFLVGDKNCISYYSSGPQIGCYSSSGFSEYRSPMTQSDKKMYESMAAQNSADTAALVRQMESTSRQMNQNSQQLLQQSNQYQAPAVNNFQQPSNNIRCISAGVYTNCRY